MDRSRWLVLPFVVVAATGIAACGDDDDDTATATTAAAADTLTEAEFLEQGNALCGAQGQEIGAVIGPLFGAGDPTPEAMQEALDQIVVLSRGIAEDLDALAEPEDLSDDVAAIVDALNAGTDEAEGQTGAEFFSTEDDPWAEAGALAQGIGLDACGPSEG